MLTCIACSKQLNNGSLNRQEDEEDPVASTTPRNKQGIKALTSQIKDIALKASGAYKSCKPCSGSSNHHHHRRNHRSCSDSDAASESGRFRCGGGSYRRTAGSSESKGISSGEATPASVSGRAESVVFVEDDEPKEWIAQVEPGVIITFVSLPQGGNDLKRIRFSRDLFNKWQAQKWWSENYDKVMELYNVQMFNDQAVPLPTPPISEAQSPKIESIRDSPVTPPLGKECPPRTCRPMGTAGYSSSDSLDRNRSRLRHHSDAGPPPGPTPKKLSAIIASEATEEEEMSSLGGSARTSLSSREPDRSGEISVSNASDTDAEWAEQDVPGVYITIRALPGGGRELRRVRFSREMFSELQARVWWDENKTRIQEQYL